MIRKHEFSDYIKATPFKAMIVQHPFWWQFVKHLPPEYECIFDCMDDISGFSNTNKPYHYYTHNTNRPGPNTNPYNHNAIRIVSDKECAVCFVSDKY